MYCIMPDEIMLDNLPSAAKLLYVKIVSLSKIKGYCFATEPNLANNIGVSNSTIIRSLKLLRLKGYILSIQTIITNNTKIGNGVLNIYPLKCLDLYFTCWKYSDIKKREYINNVIDKIKETKDECQTIVNDCDNALDILSLYLKSGIDISK